VVEADTAGMRLDQYLAAVTELSRRGARRLIAAGEVSRNGRPVLVQSRVVEHGDVVDLPAEIAGIVLRSESPSDMVQVLHADDWLLAVDKPAGVLTQPDESLHARGDALDHRVVRWLAVSEGRRPFVRLVHRLDRVTSGVVLFARDPRALPVLHRAWADGSVDRCYLAVVEGRPTFESTTLDRPIARDRSHRWRFTCDDGGKPARTHIDVVERFEAGTSVIRCRLVTGRTHQVRVHLAALGLPVLGDRLYGSRRSSEVRRPLLHARSITLGHPKTGAPLTITSPIPHDMRRFMSRDSVS
jgi:23S rRNA pseudouridine1911/1915/1917 synthase